MSKKDTVDKQYLTVKLRSSDQQPESDLGDRTDTDETSLDIQNLMDKLPREIKECSEQAALDMWITEQPRLIETLASLVGISTGELEDRLTNVPNKKGRPKRRNHPWYDLFNA